MRVKNARASRTLRQALDPRQYWLASLALLCFASSAKSQEIFLAPPDQILDALLTWCAWCTPHGVHGVPWCACTPHGVHATQNNEKLHILDSNSLVIISIWAYYTWRDGYR